MGCFYEINDTLLLTKAQGFPSHILNYKRHLKKPVTLKDVKNQIFHFKGRTAPRAFQLDPVRVFFIERTPDDKWLVWGKVLIESLTIEHKPKSKPDPENPIAFIPGNWETSGTYKIIEVYDPEYQRMFTINEAPKAWNFFAAEALARPSGD
jgi:hypothetical protein